MLQRQKQWLACSCEDLRNVVKEKTTQASEFVRGTEFVRSNSFLKRRLGRSCEELYSVKHVPSIYDQRRFSLLQKQKARLVRSCEDLRSVIKKVPDHIGDHIQQQRRPSVIQRRKAFIVKSYGEVCAALKQVPRRLQTWVVGNELFYISVYCMSVFLIKA